MKIAFNPSTVAALTTPPNNKDITFDLRGRNIFARGVKFCGTDTWRDIKINNVSIDSNTLDLRNGSNTTLTNTNGVVTINSTWRPVVDNLTSDSTTSSLSANLGRILKALIDGKSNSGHNHDDRYYTKAESNAKYITDITTSINKLTFTRNGSNITKDITVNVVCSLGNLTNISDRNSTTKASSGLFIYNSYNLVIGTNSYSSVLSINTGGTIQIAGNWGDDTARNLYWRSLSDRDVSSYPWKSWRTILDSENYSSTLDSRYYTESEVNSLLDAKLNRQNLSYGTWNPRGYNLAADYSYNGGDLSISESGGKIHVSVDGYFWLNEGQYRVLDTSDVAGLKNNLTVHLYLSNTDTTWWPLIWGGSSHNNTSDSTGTVYKSYDKLSWLTSSLTLHATNIQTNNIKNLSIGGGIYWNPYVESTTDGSDIASITVVKSGVAGGTTLVLSLMNDANDTILFKTNGSARLYHNSYPILTTLNTYVSNNKGYINNTEITLVNNADTIDGWHKDNILWTGYITSPDSLSSYWFKMYDITVTGYLYNDITITFLISEGYSAHFSIFHLRIRLNGTGNGNYALDVTLRELVGNLRDKIVAYYNNSTGNVLLWGNTGGRWNTMNYTILKKTTRTDIDLSSIGTLTAQGFSSVQTPPSTGYTRVTMARVGSVSYSESTGSVHWNNVTNKPSTFAPAAHTHTVFKNNLMIKGTNGVSDSASIHLGIGDSDTGFKWISDGKCLIYANNAAVGEWTSGGMNWFKNPTVNGNKVWNSGNDGSGSGLDADLLDGWHLDSIRKNVGYSWSAKYRINNWSRIIKIDNYSNILLAINFSQNSQASNHLYLISTGYGCGNIVQLGANGYNSNSAIKIRLTENTAISHNVEIYSTYGYNGATELSINCNYTRIDGNSTITTYLTYTAGGGTVRKEITSSYSKIVANLQGNSDTTTKLQTPRQINGTNFDGSVNITTSYWGTTRTLTIGNSGKSVNGSANISWSLSEIGAASSSHSHNYAANENYGGFTKSGRLPISGFYQSNASESGGNAPWSGWMHLINCLHSNTGNNYALLIAASFGNNNTFKIRVTNNNVNNAWRDIIHSGNIGSQTVANAYHLHINSANTWSTWYWSGLSGQPSWLWGSNDGTNMYVWNPSNFRVAYASSAGNADTVDGYHSSSFLTKHTREGAYNIDHLTDFVTRDLQPKSEINIEGTKPYDGWGMVTVLKTDNGTAQLVFDGSSNFYFRSSYGSEHRYVTSAWKQVANLNSNVASATKLQTSRTIWGQSFNGTANVSGSLSGVGHIQFSADNSYSIGTTTSEAAHTYTRQVWARHLNASRVYTGDTNLYIGYNNTAQVKFYSGTQQSGNGSNERMTISTNGNIGIGTTSPAYKLHVVGDIYTTTGFKKNGSSDSYVLLGGGGHKLESSLNVAHATTSGRSWDVSILGQHWSRLYVGNPHTLHHSSIFSISGSIGCVVFCLTFLVESSHSGNATIICLFSGSYTQPKMRALAKSDGTVLVDLFWSGNDCSLSSSTQQMTIHVIANVLLGSISPITTLTNDDTIPSGYSNTCEFLCTSRTSNFYNIRATGNSYATHFYESSDKTLKKNIKSILSSTNIPKIREFDWKDTGEHSYGFIALELEELGYGCLVSEANGKKTVNYTATLALTVAKLLNLINIQNKKISNLTKELKALKYGRKKNS